MADAARLAHPRGPSPYAPGRAALATVLAAGLALAPGLAHARGMAPEATEADPDGAPTDEPTTEAAPPGDEAPDDEGTAAAAADEDDAVDEDATVDEDDTDDEAVSDESTTPPPAEVEPLRPLQTAAWWTMFGAFAVGTTAGVLSGLAERQEDRATRLSSLFDAETGAQPLYADRKDEYEGHLRRGKAYANAALGVGIVAGVATITAITLFAIDAKRQRKTKEKPKAALRLNAGGVEVRF